LVLIKTYISWINILLLFYVWIHEIRIYDCFLMVFKFHKLFNLISATTLGSTCAPWCTCIVFFVCAVVVIFRSQFLGFPVAPFLDHVRATNDFVVSGASLCVWAVSHILLLILRLSLNVTSSRFHFDIVCSLLYIIYFYYHYEGTHLP